jgi:SET domain-containing protein
MLLVRTTLGPSRIHGLGVFAAEPITKGTVVWTFSPGFDLERDPADVLAQPEFLRERLLHYGYIDKRLHQYVLCCDDARFLNHAVPANLVSDRSADRHGVDRAARDIEAGEELTVNYDDFEER